jgi:cytochrome oxidase Cu insertion factor (SCO1/SenC/PrrC family)
MRRGSWVSVAAVAALAGLAVAIVVGTSSGWAARRIARRNAAARGGLAAWRAVKTMTLSGKLDAGARRDPVKLAMAYQARNFPGAGKHRPIGLGMAAAEKPVQLPFTMDLARPNRSRIEVQFQGQTAVQVYDGKEGWKLRPFLGRLDVEPYTDEELRTAAMQDQLDGILIDYAAKGSRLQLVKTEKVDGRDADQIKVTLANGTIRNVWVDRQSGLEVKIDGTRTLDGRPHTVWTLFRDYRSVDGRMISHRLETVVDGVSGSETIAIDRVIINPPLAEARFARPTPAQAAPQAAAPTGGTLKRGRRTEAEIEVPKVSLVRDDSKTVPFPQEIDDGKPVVLNFVFTTCGTICPVMSQIFSQLQDRLGTDRDRVHMVSISIDPEQDRPARLAEYARRFHAGPGWRHYTGTAQASLALQRAFDAYRGDKMNHTPVTFVRARPGNRWVRIDGFATPDELAGEVRAVLAHR